MFFANEFKKKIIVDHMIKFLKVQEKTDLPSQNNKLNSQKIKIN